jgi:hypothetical protein
MVTGQKFASDLMVVTNESLLTTGWMGPGIESWWGQDFLHPSRPALGPTLSLVQLVPGFFPGVKVPGCGVNHPSPSSAGIKERVELYLCCRSWLSWPAVR